MKHLDKKNRRGKYCRELVFSTELGRQRYLDFLENTTTSLNMTAEQNKLRVPPLQKNIKRGGYMYRTRLCRKNM